MSTDNENPLTVGRGERNSRTVAEAVDPLRALGSGTEPVPVFAAGVKHRVTQIDEVSRRGVCARCGPVRLKAKRKGEGRWWACAVAAGKWNRGEEAWRLAPGQRAELMEAQGGVCALCGEARRLVVDHCHRTGVVRGLLCIPCNTRLGWWEEGDGVDWSQRADRYIGRER